MLSQELRSVLVYGILVFCFGATAAAQDSGGSAPSEPASEDSESPASKVPESVSVEAVARDDDIKGRLERIFEATGWFRNPKVRVDEGVAFLTGITDEGEHSKWAEELARNTEDVVAVVNRMVVTEPPFWNIQPALRMTRELARSFVQSLPLIAIALIILIATWLVTMMILRAADATILLGIENRLLRAVARKGIGITLIMLGLYLVLSISGLSRLAMTVIGGTGLFGLVLGVAFRDIMENFLASILISIQNPFQYGDLIEVDGYKGYVQRVNMRGTLLMTFEGNHIRIPNATIYKNVITNYSSNPNVRLDFVVGIGYDAAVTRAQELAMAVLNQHPAVIQDPEPLVLVEELGSSTVNLRLYFWVNGHTHSGTKVKSSLMRQVLRKLDGEGISMPDDAREVVFPSAVPVRMLSESSNGNGGESKSLRETRDTLASASEADSELSNAAEGGFGSEADEIREQARASRDPENGSTNLLDDASSDKAPETKELVSAS